MNVGKFLSIFKKDSPEDIKIKFYMESKQWDFLLEAFAAGYKPDNNQVFDILTTEFFDENAEFETMIDCEVPKLEDDSFNRLVGFLVQPEFIITSFDKLLANKKVTDKYCNQIYSFLRNLQTTNYVQFIEEEKFRLMVQSCKKNLAILEEGYYSDSNRQMKSAISQLEAIYKNHYRAEHQKFINKIRKSDDAILSNLQYMMRDLPESVQLLAKIINTNIQQIDVEKLGAESRKDFLLLTERSLPTLLTQYASMDKTLLSYTNSDNKTIEDVLKSSLTTIKDKVETYRQEIGKSEMKQITILDRQLKSL